MLLIGDIHIQAKYAPKIIESLRRFVDDQKDEKNVVFMGDFVYHFSYHRKSLLQLFAFFVELYQQGKHVYVLAGNHDRLGEHFVYAEGQFALDALQAVQGEGAGSLQFITEPLLTKVEDKEILFLPFMLDKPRSEGTIENRIETAKIAELSKELMKSDNKYEEFSGVLNQYLLQEVEPFLAANKELTIIHHYYVADTKFPGQKTSFKYRDIALCPEWMKVPGLRMISGHIHQAFTINNYLCLGSVRSTSPLESNHLKYFWKRDTKTDQFEAIATHLNPYIRFDRTATTEANETLGQAGIDAFWKQIIADSEAAITAANAATKVFDITFTHKDPVWAECHLALTTLKIDYDLLPRLVDSNLHDQFLSIKLYKKRQHVSNLLAQLETSTKDFSGGWHDWKAILHEYLEKKYPNEIGSYLDEMAELGLN